MKQFLITIVCFVIGLSALSCKKDEIVDPHIDIPEKQKDIEWPGLAKSPWPMFMQNPQLTGRSRNKGPQNGVINWMYSAESWVYSSPVIDENGNIYFGSDDGNLYSVNKSGALNWKFKTTAPIISSPLLSSDSTIYFLRGVGTTESNGALFAIDRGGQLKWKFDLLGIPSQSSPTISFDGKTLFVKTSEPVSLPSHLYAISLTGVKKWEIVKVGDEKFSIYSPSFSTDGSTLYIPGETKMYAVDTSGSIIWQFNVDGDASSSASVDNDDNIYFTTGNTCYSLSKSGVLRWTFPAVSTNEPPMPSITYDGRIVIVTDDTAGYSLVALDNAGKFLWKSLISGFSQGNPISDIDGNVYVGAIGRISVIDSVNFCSIRKDGIANFRIKLRSPDGSIPDIDSTPAIDAFGNLYVGSDRPNGRQLFSMK